MNMEKQYKRAKVENATDLEAVVLLYQEAILRLEKAKVLFRAKDQAFKDEIDYASKIIKGLALIIDFKQGGEIAQNLYSLYNYMDKRLLVAREGIRATEKYCDEIISMLSSLQESWDTIAEKEKEKLAQSKDTKPVNGHLELHF